MNATRLLRWSLPLVLGIPAVALALSAHHAPPIAIGVTEAIGAAQLQPRRTRRLGTCLPLLALVAAASLHALSGDKPPAAFLFYAAALAVVATPC